MDSVLQVRNLGFSYDGSRQIFKAISFDVNAGEIICLVGPNGIGKTTLLNCLAGLWAPLEGSVLLDGKNMAGMPARDIARMIGYVPQTLHPSFDYTVLEYVVTGNAPWLNIFEKPGPEHYQRAEEALEQMAISHLADKRYTRLSTGELQQVSIARAIAQKARLILMDEPTAHLDYGNQLKVLRLIKGLSAKGYAVVLTTHNPDQVLLLDAKTAVIDHQSLFHFGAWQDILTEELLSGMYGTALRLTRVEGVDRMVCIVPGL